MTALPFLSSYDPPAASEGTLDPLGLYQIADQLATRLVPSVRERMQRIRFLTAISLGGLVTEGMDADPRRPDSPPFFVWEWLVVEAIIRSSGDDPGLWGVPGTLVTRRAIAHWKCLDHRSYLKVPRVFGFHGVYKRLGIHLGLVDVHLQPLPESERLVDAWARDAGYGSLRECQGLIDKWRKAVQRSLAESPPRTNPGFGPSDWDELAKATVPHGAGSREKAYLRNALLADGERSLGALPSLWRLQQDLDDDHLSEELLHQRLEYERPDYAPLLKAIRTYEFFCRSLLDAFDLLRAEASQTDSRGFQITSLASAPEFSETVKGLDRRCAEAHQCLGQLDLQLDNAFESRFGVFSEPLEPASCALAICKHHERVQQQKGRGGKLPWFDRLGHDRIFLRHNYRESRRPIMPQRFVHDYRVKPIRYFYNDLT